MAQRRNRELTKSEAASVAQKARRATELATVSEMADRNLVPTEAWRTVLPEHIEAIKTRTIGGDTLSNICKGMGLDRANVLRHFHENPELLKLYMDWKAFGAHALYENLLDLPFDPTMSDNDKMLYYKVVANYAPKINRKDYGEKTQVDIVQHQVFVMPQDIIDGEGF